MRKIKKEHTFDIADPRARAWMMIEAINELEKRPELSFVTLLLIATFIDGLAKGRLNQTKAAYVDYLRNNFPELCEELGAEVFYAHFRGAGVHEFGVRPPFGLVNDDESASYVSSLDNSGVQVTALNLSRLVADFRRHVKAMIE